MALGNGLPRLAVVFDRPLGRVTVCALDVMTDQPLRLRADVMSLYLRLSLGAGPPPVRVWLDPVETETDEVGLTWATRFSGDSPALRGAPELDGMLPRIIIRGLPFWGVAVHVGGPATSGRAK